MTLIENQFFRINFRKKYFKSDFENFVSFLSISIFFFSLNDGKKDEKIIKWLKRVPDKLKFDLF